MKRSAILGAVFIAACAAALAPAMVSPAMAGGWWHRDGYAAPRHYRKSYRSVPRAYDGSVRYYNSPRAYRSACGVRGLRVPAQHRHRHRQPGVVGQVPGLRRLTAGAEAQSSLSHNLAGRYPTPDPRVVAPQVRGRPAAGHYSDYVIISPRVCRSIGGSGLISTQG